ncbi:hypothetical protein DPMN_175347 [Dreissena polymorpha]|uniref:Uncharacterized protein n=1 Tax=Dreissena polymorpha TaxID=45954 RepID=A0A9D4IIN3_DREPO|nr:hypothetical protein DPMN_175347 [Dreissena polymorpha]
MDSTGMAELGCKVVNSSDGSGEMSITCIVRVPNIADSEWKSIHIINQKVESTDIEGNKCTCKYKQNEFLIAFMTSNQFDK